VHLVWVQSLAVPELPELINSSNLETCRYNTWEPIIVATFPSKINEFPNSLTRPLQVSDNSSNHFPHDVHIYGSNRRPPIAPKYQQTGYPNIHMVVTSYMRDVIGSDREIRKVAASFFKSVQQWLPVVSEVRLNERLNKLHSQPSAEVALLLLCMHLLLKTPCQESDPTMQSQLYKSTKLTLALVQLAIGPSAKIAQSELVLSVYEYGHALSHAALQTIGSCFKTAYSLGWHMTRYWTDIGRSTNQAATEEEKCTWWGILMLDR
jgi:hypothetical protein